MLIAVLPSFAWDGTRALSSLNRWNQSLDCGKQQKEKLVLGLEEPRMFLELTSLGHLLLG